MAEAEAATTPDVCDAGPMTTRVPARMSWSACFRSVNAAIRNPMPRISAERIFAKWRPVALPNPIRLPSRSVTRIPSAIFPSVACFVELSISAEYSHQTTVEMLE